MKRYDIITIFPKILDSYFGETILGRASEAKLIQIKTHNLRDFSLDKKHKKVDDRPFGGGPGMVLQVQPIYDAVKSVISKNKKSKKRVILFSTRGHHFDNATAKRLAKYDQLIFICGRYEGVDERVAQYIADEEISLGDYVLSGGELPSAIVIEAVSRYIPGVLGKYESLEDVKGSYPVYTRPEIFIQPKTKKKMRVPKVLLTGNHKKIKDWRSQKSDTKSKS